MLSDLAWASNAAAVPSHWGESFNNCSFRIIHFWLTDISFHFIWVYYLIFWKKKPLIKCGLAYLESKTILFCQPFNNKKKIKSGVGFNSGAHLLRLTLRFHVFKITMVLYFPTLIDPPKSQHLLKLPVENPQIALSYNKKWLLLLLRSWQDKMWLGQSGSNTSKAEFPNPKQN